jgi:hypothetical protein
LQDLFQRLDALPVELSRDLAYVTGQLHHLFVLIALILVQEIQVRIRQTSQAKLVSTGQLNVLLGDVVAALARMVFVLTHVI